MCKANDSVRIVPASPHPHYFPAPPFSLRPGHIMCTFFTWVCTRLRGDNSIDNQQAATKVFLPVFRAVFLARFSDFPQLSTMPVGSAIKIIRFPHCGHTLFFTFFPISFFFFRFFSFFGSSCSFDNYLHCSVARLLNMNTNR